MFYLHCHIYSNISDGKEEHIRDIEHNIICYDVFSTAILEQAGEASWTPVQPDAFRPRTKHIDLRYHYLRDKIENGLFEVDYLSTGRMAADSLTKAVTIEKFETCRNAIGIWNVACMVINLVYKSNFIFQNSLV